MPAYVWKFCYRKLNFLTGKREETQCNETVPCHKFYCCSVNTTFGIFSRGPLKCVLEDNTVLPSGIEAGGDRNSLSKICVESDSDISFTKIIPSEGN